MDHETDVTIQDVVQDIAKRLNMVYCQADKCYYIYRKKTGLYKRLDEVEMSRLIGDYINRDDKYNLEWDMSNISCICDHLKLKLPYPEHMGTESNILHLQNGVYRFDKMEFGKFNPKYYATAALPFAYDSKASSPVFDRFIKEVSCSDAMAATLIEIAGCVLAGRTDHGKLILNAGTGANGKSVYLSLLSLLLGRDLVTSIPVSEINGNRAFVLHELAGKRLNALHELEHGISMEKLFDSNVKRIVTNEVLNAEVKYGNRYQFTPNMNFIVNTNYLPEVSGSVPAYAVKRRYLILRWERTFKPEEQDKMLLEHLTAELPGIFNRALEGLERMRNNGFIFSAQKESDEYLKEFIVKKHPAYGFVEEFVIEAPDNQLFNDDLRNAYITWTEKRGLDASENSPCGLTKALKKAITMKGFQTEIGKSNGKRYIRGIALKGGSYVKDNKKSDRRKNGSGVVGTAVPQPDSQSKYLQFRKKKNSSRR